MRQISNYKNEIFRGLGMAIVTPILLSGALLYSLFRLLHHLEIYLSDFVNGQVLNIWLYVDIIISLAAIAYGIYGRKQTTKVLEIEHRWSVSEEILAKVFAGFFRGLQDGVVGPKASRSEAVASEKKADI